MNNEPEAYTPGAAVGGQYTHGPLLAAMKMHDDCTGASVPVGTFKQACECRVNALRFRVGAGGGLLCDTCLTPWTLVEDPT